MKQALILCAGNAVRLRPYSYSITKSCFPFLNLPLLSYSWFYLEQLKVNHFMLNSHLFFKQLESTVDFLSIREQKTDLFFEPKPLGSAGTLYHLKKQLQKSEYFIYINGDSVFFPSNKSTLLDFENYFLNSESSALFYTIPYQKETQVTQQAVPIRQDLNKRALYCDKDLNLKAITYPSQLKDNSLSPFTFTGLALIKSSLLDHLKESDTDIFQDFISKILATHKVKVFIDNSAVLLEVGNKNSYLQATEFCLNQLFNKTQINTQNNSTKQILKECFKRFDVKDQKVGLKNGLIWSEKLGFPLLAPNSVKGLDLLKLKGYAVLGSRVNIFNTTSLENTVIGSSLAINGKLKNELLVL